MNIVYIGAVRFSRFCLGEVLKQQGQVVGVITTDDPRINSDYEDLTVMASEREIPWLRCRDVNLPEVLSWIREREPDILFCWGWSQLLKQGLLTLAPMGAVGVHPALLPQNRGRHPLVWALALGLKESGLTFFFLDEGADSGPILSQEPLAIDDEDTAATMYRRIEESAARQIAQFLPTLVNGTFNVTPQDETKANYWRKRTPVDGQIDWRMSERTILNLVRALTTPYPGATCARGDVTITVWRARAYPQIVPENLEPGKVLSIIEGNPVIKCSDGAIQLEEYWPRIAFLTGEYLL